MTTGHETLEYQVCCITMSWGDRLRLVGTPPELIPFIRHSICQSWGVIQAERQYHGSHEFKLKGNPWYVSDQGDNAVPSRRLLLAVLTTMAKQGWNLIQPVDISKSDSDMDSLFFERGVVDDEAKMFAVSFHLFDRIRIIDAPEYFPHLKDAVRQHWPKGIQRERDYRGSLELKLAGNPWLPHKAETVNSSMLLAQIITNFRLIGYKLYGSVDISGGSDTDCLIFRKINTDWP